jgi:hypothetical protein
MVVKTQTKTSELRYFEQLPVVAEPQYRDGYTCDVCKQDFFTGPFFHSVQTGEDRCISCSIGTGLYDGPVGFWKEIYTPLHLKTTQPYAVVDVVDGKVDVTVPVFAYRSASNLLGIFFSNSTCLVAEMGEISIVRGWVRKGTDVGVEVLDGSDLVERYPLLTLWGDLHQLSNSSLFRCVAFGSPRPLSIQSPEAVVFVTSYGYTANGALGVRFSNGLVQLSSRDHRSFVVWNAGPKPTVVFHVGSPASIADYNEFLNLERRRLSEC